MKKITAKKDKNDKALATTPINKLKDKVDQVLTHRERLPLDAEVEKELNKICERGKFD